MNSNFYPKLFVLLLLFLVSYHESLPLRIKGKKIIINSNSWALEWFQKNKNELISLTDLKLKFKLHKELAKYSKINQNIFNEIFSKILVHQKRTKLLEKTLIKDNIYSIRMGK